MYVCACRELKLDGGRVARLGEPVPEAEAWPENIQKANIRYGTIRLADKPDHYAERWKPKELPVGVVVAIDKRVIPPYLLKECMRGVANVKIEAQLADEATAPAEELVRDALSPNTEGSVEAAMVAPGTVSADLFDDLLGPQTPKKPRAKKRGRKRKKGG